MSIGSDSQTTSQLLSSSRSSLTASKKAPSEISKTYKHASNFYLTRRLAETYETLQPVIKPPVQTNGHTADDEHAPLLAPIATASTSQRIKIWSLYATLLDAIIDLGSDEGAKQFGQKEYRDILRWVQNGDVWDQVVRDGYRGREDSVDAEVVYNLSTLLLARAPDQSVNQSRLETYLSSSSRPEIDISAHVSESFRNGTRSHMNGASTPKDLRSRIKIIELFTLHVLPRNDDWEYARSFIANSDILDDERRDAFLQTLSELQEAKEQEAAFSEDVADYTEDETSPAGTTPLSTQSNGNPGHQRSSSEVDYGIEKAHPNGTVPTTTQSAATPTPTATPQSPPPATPSMTALPPQPEPTPKSRPPHLSPPAHTPRRPSRRSKAPPQNTLAAQARQLFGALSNLARNLAGSITGNPSAILRMLLFMLAFFMAFSRREIRERAQLILGKSWDKMRRTLGMGVKVSYI